MLLQGLQCSEAPLAEAAHGRGPDHMVLRVELQLLHCLEGQAALVAAVLVDVAIGDGQLRPLVVDLIEVHLEGVGRLEDLIATFLPTQESSRIIPL